MVEKKDRKATNNHCKEVSELMEGKIPFLTRHGVTIVVAIIAIGMAVLFMMDGAASDLAKGMACQIMEQISAKATIPNSIR